MVTPTRKKDRIDALAATTASTSENGSSGGDSGVSLAASAWRRLRRNPVFLLGLGIIVAFVVGAILSPWLAPYDPAERMLADQVVKARNEIPPAQPGHPLGGDDQGRDLLSRLLVGSQQTLLVGVCATLLGLAGGLVLGTVAGAIAGWADSLVMRAVDVMLSIPGILLAVSIAALFPRPGLYTVIIAVSMVQVPVFARLLRGSMLAQRASDHVLAARALGVKKSAIVFRHMLPNSLGPVIVQSTLVLALSIIDAAALSFLGLGNPNDNIPEWGQMLGNAQIVIDTHPHLAFWPAGCIIAVALGFTLVGESLRDALDPKNRR
jgi:peptide/nickel transport system permease protein